MKWRKGEFRSGEKRFMYFIKGCGWKKNMSFGMFLMIKTEIFKANGRVIFSCNKLPDKGIDKTYR